MERAMLVRTMDGAWERLQAQDAVPEGGLTEIFGDDIGPVLGAEEPMLVVASKPRLASGSPDALCVSPSGVVSIVSMSVGPSDPSTLATLLAHAGAMQAMSYQEFERACDPAAAGHGSLAEWVEDRCKGVDFHGGTFEVTVADALSQGRFHLVAVVSQAQPTLTQSMTYLNSSGAADVSCFEFASFASSSVTALQVNALDVGQQRQAVVLQMTAAGVLAAAERVHGEHHGRLVAQMQKFCAGAFDEMSYDGDNTLATMSAWVTSGQHKCRFLTAGSDGSIVIHFDDLAPCDGDWTVRAELVQGLNRLLGAEVGDARKIKEVVMSIGEHLNDATLMELLTEIVNDALSVLRATAGQTSANGAPAPAAAAA